MAIELKELQGDWRGLTRERVRSAREAGRYSQEEFGELLAGMAEMATGQHVPRPGQPTISRWENGGLSPGPLYGPAIMRLEEVRRQLARWRLEIKGQKEERDGAA